jgi:glycosyltransferase involved in cell wall biosynthesis
MNIASPQSLIELPVARSVASLALLLRGGLFGLSGRRYRALDDYCRAERLSSPGFIRRIAESKVNAAIANIRAAASNPVLADYLADDASRADAAVFALEGKGGRAELLRDLIVLKAATADEKGVILLKYARTFSAVIALLDLPRLMQRYVFVLEPCWAGYCDPSILMYVAPGNPVMVMCFTKEDHAFVERVGPPLVPLRMGPADWVNADVFRAPEPRPKIYDLVMVANWARHKRHAQLFGALSTIRDRDVRVLLVGFAWSDRTADDIRREAAAMGNPRITVDIRENVKHETLSQLLAQCKAFVFLSRKEGDNKAVVEAMFADVPAIVFADTIGGAGSRVNSATGVFASDAQLAQKIVHMLDHHREFSPRAWALEHTGSAVATRVLDDALRAAVTASGGRYTRGIVEKTNAPNLAYKDVARRAEFAADYDFILGCRRRA